MTVPWLVVTLIPVSVVLVFDAKPVSLTFLPAGGVIVKILPLEPEPMVNVPLKKDGLKEPPPPYTNFKSAVAIN